MQMNTERHVQVSNLTASVNWHPKYVHPIITGFPLPCCEFVFFTAAVGTMLIVNVSGLGGLFGPLPLFRMSQSDMPDMCTEKLSHWKIASCRWLYLPLYTVIRAFIVYPVIYTVRLLLKFLENTKGGHPISVCEAHLLTCAQVMDYPLSLAIAVHLPRQ